jgi:hypothetical protein
MKRKEFYLNALCGSVVAIFFSAGQTGQTVWSKTARWLEEFVIKIIKM